MLSWKVLNYDFNKRKIVDYEIFGKYSEDELRKARRQKKFNSYDTLKEWLKSNFLHDYWCKCECEIMVGPLFPRRLEDIDDFEKIDIYRQLEMNLDRITEYVIREMKFKF